MTTTGSHRRNSRERTQVHLARDSPSSTFAVPCPFEDSPPAARTGRAISAKSHGRHLHDDPPGPLLGASRRDLSQTAITQAFEPRQERGWNPEKEDGDDK